MTSVCCSGPGGGGVRSSLRSPGCSEASPGPAAGPSEGTAGRAEAPGPCRLRHPGPLPAGLGWRGILARGPRPDAERSGTPSASHSQLQNTHSRPGNGRDLDPVTPCPDPPPSRCVDDAPAARAASLPRWPSVAPSSRRLLLEHRCQSRIGRRKQRKPAVSRRTDGGRVSPPGAGEPRGGSCRCGRSRCPVPRGSSRGAGVSPSQALRGEETGRLVSGRRRPRLSGHREKAACLSRGLLEASTRALIGEAWPRVPSRSGSGWSGGGRQVHGGRPLPHPIHGERGVPCPQRRVRGEDAGQAKATGVRQGPHPGLPSCLHGKDVPAPGSFVNPVTPSPPLWSLDNGRAAPTTCWALQGVTANPVLFRTVFA